MTPQLETFTTVVYAALCLLGVLGVLLLWSLATLIGRVQRLETTLESFRKKRKPAPSDDLPVSPEEQYRRAVAPAKIPYGVLYTLTRKDRK